MSTVQFCYESPRGSLKVCQVPKNLGVSFRVDYKVSVHILGVDETGIIQEFESCFPSSSLGPPATAINVAYHMPKLNGS